MAGNSETPNPADNQNAKPKPRLKAFICSNCGSSVTIRYPGLSLSAVCDSCHTVFDVTNENYAILDRYRKSTATFQPKIELGTRGKLKGKEWEVIGFIARFDIASHFFWDEYLLFNPYYGYRWLTEAEGHWNFVTPIKEKPEVSGTATSSLWGGERAHLKQTEYKLFYRGKAEVAYVLGEFYWKVRIHSQVSMSDYVSPPLMLSSETDDREITWSQSEYTEADEIIKAFKITKKINRSYNIAPNQPALGNKLWNSVRQNWMIFLCLLTGLQIVTAVMLHATRIYDGSFTYDPNTKQSDITTPVFKVSKGPTAVAINFQADVDNSWFYVAGDLVNDKDGRTFSFERTCEYYHGFDSDGSWSEGSSNARLVLSSVPAGDYYLNMDIESGDYKDSSQRSFYINATEGVTLWENYFIALFLVSIYPIIACFMNYSAESSRWQQSDFNPYQSSSDD